MDDFWDGVKGRAILAQDVLAIFTLGELHVHETLAAPVRKKKKNGLRKGRSQKKKSSGRDLVKVSTKCRSRKEREM